MAESSAWWTTDGTGDGKVGGYTRADHSIFMAVIAACCGFEGVAPGYRNELAPSAGEANEVLIAAGGAMVDGKPYDNSTVKSMYIPSASGAGNTRIDRIVVRTYWAYQEVRLHCISGINAASPSPPAISQLPSNIYDITICQVLVDTSGNVIVTDERTWAQTNSNGIASNAITTAKISDGAITAAKISGGAVGTSMLANGAVTSAKIANETIVDEDISSTAAIAQSKISNAFPAIDADKVDGKHASDLVAASVMDDMQTSTSIQNATDTHISGGSYAAVANMSRSVNVSGACDLFIYSTVAFSSTGYGTLSLRVIVDSTGMDEYGVYVANVGNVTSMHWYFGNLGAGSHTIKLQAKTNVGDGVTLHNRRMSVVVIPRS